MRGFCGPISPKGVKSDLLSSYKRRPVAFMSVYQVDPVRDPRWPAFLARHPDASVFHTPEWLAALRLTYGYAPVVFTTSAAGEELKNGIAFCRVRSWIMGCRMVSVPFSDHCQPLVENAGDLNLLLSSLQEDWDREKWKYIEIRALVPTLVARASRPLFREVISNEVAPIAGRLGRGNERAGGTPALPGFSPSEEFYFHRLDLRPSLDVLLHNFHKSCVQRKIQRADREHLSYEAGRTEAIVAKFYRMLLLTRRRHQLPPQPIAWFRNLVACLGDKLTVRVVSKDGQPIAGILTLSYKNCLVYKYGGSDARFHNLGGMPLLFWKAIQEGKERGAREFDLGRSEIDNPGLVAFKNHLGATCSKLGYSRAARPARYGANAAGVGSADWKLRLVKGAFARMPDSMLRVAGSLLYRHVG